jgi:hypothetical protein
MNRIAYRLAPALVLFAAPAAALAAPAEPFATATVLDDQALAEQRGGFTWDGLQISLGATMRTYLNGELALQSTLSWTPEGASRSETVYGALTPAGADQLVAGMLTSGRISMNVGAAQVYLANDGQTALVQRTDGGIQNILVNTANNVDIRQQVDATLDLSGYAGFAQRNLGEQVAGSIGAAVGGAAIGAVTH